MDDALDTKTSSAIRRRKQAEKARREALEKKAQLEERLRRERYQTALLEREAAAKQKPAVVVASLRRPSAQVVAGFGGLGSRDRPPVAVATHAVDDVDRSNGNAVAGVEATVKASATTEVRVMAVAGSEPLGQFEASHAFQTTIKQTAGKRQSVIEIFVALEQAASAVKTATENLGNVHKKWTRVAKKRETSNWNDDQRRKEERDEYKRRQDYEIWLEREEETRQKLAQIHLAEQMETDRLRKQGEDRLRLEAEKRAAEEREEAAERSRRTIYARRYQEKKMKEREEKEKAIREEREAIELLRAQERAENIAAEKEKERRANEAREAALARKREELQQKRKQQQAEKQRREQETKERFERIKEQQRIKEVVRKDMERKAKAAAAEAKLKAAESEKELEEQAAAAKNEAARRSKMRQESEKKEAEATLARVQHSEKLTKKLLKETRQLAAGFEQDARNREEEAKARYDAEMRAKREIEFKRRQDEHLRDIEATKRHKAWQAAEVREKLRREAYEAATKKALAEEERERIAEANERERMRYDKEWKDHVQWKARQYAEDLARRRAKADEQKKQRVESFKELVQTWHEQNDTHLAKVQEEKLQVEKSRKDFREHVLRLKQKHELAMRKQHLDAEECAAEQARLEAMKANAELQDSFEAFSEHRQSMRLSTVSGFGLDGRGKQTVDAYLAYTT